MRRLMRVRSVRRSAWVLVACCVAVVVLAPDPLVKAGGAFALSLALIALDQVSDQGV